MVWEFGRVGVCEMGRGRVVEIGELKTGIGGLRNTWGIRRVEGKVEGMFLGSLLGMKGDELMLSKCWPYSLAPQHKTHFLSIYLTQQHLIPA